MLIDLEICEQMQPSWCCVSRTIVCWKCVLPAFGGVEWGWNNGWKSWHLNLSMSPHKEHRHYFWFSPQVFVCDFFFFNSLIKLSYKLWDLLKRAGKRWDSSMPTALFLSCAVSCDDAQTGFEGRAGMTRIVWRCCRYLSSHWLGTFQVVLFAMGLDGVIVFLDARNHT